jgi:hypothetical protein
MTSASIASDDCFLVFSLTHQRRDYPIRRGRQSSHNAPGSTESVSLLDIPLVDAVVFRECALASTLDEDEFEGGSGACCHSPKCFSSETTCAFGKAA